jgi:hypothetical protein
MEGDFFMNYDFYANLPLVLVYDERYSALSSRATVLYTLFLNRKKLSANNKRFCDSNGIFIYYSIPQICNHLHCGKDSARSAVTELEQAGLIRKECQKNGLPLKIYVNDIQSSSKTTHYSASQTPQDKPLHKPYLNSFNREKAPAAHLPKKEKQVSFDVDLEREMEYKNLMTFAQKTKKRRTRNTGPTI